MKQITFLFILILLFSCEEENKDADSELNETENVYETFIDERDGNEYKYVTIGEQKWMAENLAYLPKVNKPDANSSTEPYYFVYGFEGITLSTAKTYETYKKTGVLYNWTAACESCPNGWHLPSDEEWVILENYIKVNNDSTAVGKILKSDDGWLGYMNGTNDYYFSAIPSGYRGNYDDSFNGISEWVYFWTSTEEIYEEKDRYARYRYLSGSIDVLIKENSGWGKGWYKGYGFSVRCIKDE